MLIVKHGKMKVASAGNASVTLILPLGNFASWAPKYRYIWRVAVMTM